MSAESNSEKSAQAPIFFWYDNDKVLKVCFLMTRIKVTLESNGIGLMKRETSVLMRFSEIINEI